MKKSRIIFLAVLVISLALNGFYSYKFFKEKEVWNLHFENANSWDTYFSVHHIKEAQEMSTGKNIKVGILDHYFGTKVHPELYAGEKDFLNESQQHGRICEHGYWMSCTLKEVAPDCQVYALSVLDSNEEKKVDAMVKAIDWAIDNKIDILTYSDQSIEDENNKALLDAAVEKAEKNGILISFIHYDHPYNLKPITMYEEDEDTLSQKTNVTMYSYDYNLLFKDDFYKYGMGKTGTDDALMMFYSESSMSIVTGGFMALLKSVNPTLKPAQYREILIDSAHENIITEPQTLMKMELKHVADIKQAIYMLEDEYGTLENDQEK